MPSKLEEMTGSSNTLKGVVISPEGAEEKMIREVGFRITLTQGGRYRLYSMNTGEDGKMDAQPVALLDTLEGAKKHSANLMGTMAALEIDPRKTLDALFRHLGSKK